MSESFDRLLRETADREYGGIVPRSVWQIAQRAGTEARSALLRQEPEFDREKLYAIEMIAVDTALRVACEVIYRERHRSGSPDWNSGFGNVSLWNLNGRK